MAKVRIKKAYVAHDLSRNRFMTEKHKQQVLRKIDESDNGRRIRCHGYFLDKDTGRIYRVSRPNRRAQYLRHCSNKKLRSNKNFDINNSGYRKNYDFWWELY